MANSQEYLGRLQTADQHLHGSGARWLRTQPVHEAFQGKTVWEGRVETFELTGHPKATRAYA